MCGAGINEYNVARVTTETGCKEAHSSARSEIFLSSKLSMGGSVQDLQPLMVCDFAKVQEMLEILKTLST